jgi:hypothetical protein
MLWSNVGIATSSGLKAESISEPGAGAISKKTAGGKSFATGTLH